MLSYILRRLLLIVPTLFGILLINFIIIQAAPGGPVEQMIAKLEGFDAASGGATGRISGGGGGRRGRLAIPRRARPGPGAGERDRAHVRLRQVGPERFMIMLKNYLHLDFGQSFFRDAKVTDLIVEKLPVSISLGLWSTLIMYLVSIPLGIARRPPWQRLRHLDQLGDHRRLRHSRLPLRHPAGGAVRRRQLLGLVPLRGLTSNNFDQLSLGGKVLDYFWHLAPGNRPGDRQLRHHHAADQEQLPRRDRQAIRGHRPRQGLTERRVLYGHVFRNAMLLVIAGLPAALLGIFFTGSLLIEVIFSLDGLGLLSFEAAMNRDYPVVFGTLFIFTLFGLVMKLISDIVYTLVDPRIDFENRESDAPVSHQPAPLGFKSNKRGWWSLWLFLILFVGSLGAELIANDKPLVVHYDGGWYSRSSNATRKPPSAANSPGSQLQEPLHQPTDRREGRLGAGRRSPTATTPSTTS